MERRNFLKNGGMVIGAAAAATAATTASACVPTASAKVNVKDYCAVGDGVTDDTAAINNAIAALPTGGIVYFPPGKYKVSSTIVLKTFLTLYGDSADCTALLASVTNQKIFSDGTGSLLGINISGLRFDANGHTNVTGISLVLPRLVYITKCIFTCCFDSISVDRGFEIKVFQCRSEGSGIPGVSQTGRLNFFTSISTAYSSGIYVDQYTMFNAGQGVNSPCINMQRTVACVISNIEVNDATFGGAPAIAISFTGDCQGCRVIGGVIASGAAGVYFGVDTTTSVPTYCSVSELELDQQTTAAIWVGNAGTITISNCNITASVTGASAKGGIVTAGSGIVFQGCKMTGFTSGQGLLFGANVQYSASIGCYYMNCQYGIGVVSGGTATGFNITGNTFVSVTTKIIQSLSATGNMNLVRNNIGTPDQI